MDPRDPLPTFIAIQQQLPAAQLRRQRERLFRILLWVLAGFALVLVVLGIMAARFDPNAHRAQIEATMRTATGRDFHINGRMTLTSWRHMTIAASDVTLANVAGGSKPEMMHLGRVEADLRPISLMLGYIRIPRLVLEDAEILLERMAAATGSSRRRPPPPLPRPQRRRASPRRQGAMLPNRAWWCSPCICATPM
jgi:hypothetical protein